MGARGWLLVLVLLILQPTAARAIECRTDHTPAAQLVCDAPSISVLNDDLILAVGRLNAALDADGRAALLLAQRDWENDLSSCMSPGNEAAAAQCLRGRFRDRIKLLSGTSVDGAGPVPRMQPLPVKVKPIPGDPDFGVLLLRFAQPASPGEVTFNAIADRIAREARAGTLDAHQTGNLLLGFEMSVVSDRLISAKYTYGYTCDGCGDESDLAENYNIDVRTGKLLDIPTLFSTGGLLGLSAKCLGQVIRARGGRLQEMSAGPDAVAKRDVRDVVAADEFDSMSDGMSTVLPDQTNWSIDANGITISFSVNAMGGYLEGPYECRIPMDDVRRMALPDAPLP